MDFLGFLKKNKLDVLLVLALFFLAFGIRSVTSNEFPQIYGFDSYWAAKWAKNIITDGYVWPANDTTTLYPYGRVSSSPGELGWWGLEALSYKIAALAYGENTNQFSAVTPGFDYTLFARVASWLTAIVGALAIPAAYLFGRVAFNRYAGLGAALFLATSANHLFYSIYGHAENDALGLTLLFVSLFLFALTLKKRDWRVGVLLTLSLVWLNWTWQSYQVVVILVVGIIALYFAITAILDQVGYYKKSLDRSEHRKWLLYAGLFVLASALLAHPVKNEFTGFTVGVLGFSLLFSSIIDFFVNQKAFSVENLKQTAAGKTLAFSLGAIVLGVLFTGVHVVKDPLFFVGINAFPEPNPEEGVDYLLRLRGTIAEQNPIAGGDFLARLDTLARSGFGVQIWFALLGVIALFGKVFVMPFVRKDFTYEMDVLAIAFVLLSMWTLTQRAVTIFFLAGAVAFGAGLFFGAVSRFVELVVEKTKTSKGLPMTVVLLFVLATGLAYNVNIIPAAEGFGFDINPEWFSTFTFINAQLPKNSVITAWWDYGHWMSYYNGDHASVTTDNAQYAPSIYTTAVAFTKTTPCRVDQEAQQIVCESSQDALDKAELDALSILKPMGTTHILIDKEIVGGIQGGKFGALTHIANVQLGCFQNINCRDEGDKVSCLFGKNEQGKDVGLTFTREQWREAEKVNWPGAALNQYGLPARAFFRTDSSGPNIYMSALSCGNQFSPNANAPIIYSLTHRLFFRDPSFKHLKLVYDDGWNVIFEIDWKGVPDPVTSVLPNYKSFLAEFNARLNATGSAYRP